MYIVSKVLLYRGISLKRSLPPPLDDYMALGRGLQGYLAHMKTHPPLGPPYVPRYSPSVGSKAVAFIYERCTPAL